MASYSDIDQTHFTPDKTPRKSGGWQSLPDNFKVIIIVVAITAAVVSAWVLVSAIVERQSKDTITIQTDKDASITLIQAYKDPIEAGKGSKSVHVDPGTYTVIASSDTKHSLKTIRTSASTTTVDLPLQENTKSGQVTTTSSADIFADGTKLSFLNNDTSIPNAVTIGDAVPLPAFANTYPATQIFWITSNSFFVLQNEVWKYVSNGQISNLNVGSGLASNDTIAFLQTGAYAYINRANDVMYAAQPTAVPTKLGTVSDDYSLTLLPNNSVVAYPTANDISSNKKVVQFKDTPSRALNISSEYSISYMLWSEDSSKAIFSTNKGLHLYLAASDQVVDILNASEVEQRGFVWINNDDVLFAYDRNLWRFSTKTNSAVALASFQGNLSATTPRISGDIAYFGTDDDEKGGALYQVALTANASKQITTLPKVVDTKYINFDDITKNGISADQLTNVRFAVSKFIATLPKPPEEAVVSYVTKEPKNGEDDRNTITFNVQADNSSYSVTVDYWSVSNVQVRINNGLGQPVFDSGELN